MTFVLQDIFSFLVQQDWLTYVITPWSRILLKKQTGSQLVKKFPAFYGTRKFITAFTRNRHLSLSWASLIQSMPPNSTSWRSILILSSHLRLGLPSGLFPTGFRTKTLYVPCIARPFSLIPCRLVGESEYTSRESRSYMPVNHCPSVIGEEEGLAQAARGCDHVIGVG
jgi:hypothetical protein